MRSKRFVVVGGALLTMTLGALPAMSGCGGPATTENQTEESKEITKQKMEEMQKGMMGAVKNQPKSKPK